MKNVLRTFLFCLLFLSACFTVKANAGHFFSEATVYRSANGYWVFECVNAVGQRGTHFEIHMNNSDSMFRLIGYDVYGNPVLNTGKQMYVKQDPDYPGLYRSIYGYHPSTSKNASGIPVRGTVEVWYPGGMQSCEISWTTTANATCTSQGINHGRCWKCGVEYDESTPALGHEWNWVTDSHATCTQYGLKHEHCNRCGANQNMNTKWDNPKGHDWRWAIDSNLSCTTDYAGHKHCVRDCHNEGRGDGPVNQSRVVFQKAPGHHYEELINEKEASCTEPGKSHYQCTNIINGKRCTSCEPTFQIPATGHFITSDKVTEKPSVYKNGKRTYYCEYCKKPITERDIAHRHFNSYVGDKKVARVYTGDNLVWNGSVGEVGTDGGKTSMDDIFSMVENNWYYIKSHYVNQQNTAPRS